MANTSPLLLNYLNTKADINFYTQEQIYWANKAEAITAQLSKATAKEEKWNDAYDKIMELDDGKCVTYKDAPFYNNECDAIRYADLLVGEDLDTMVAELTEESIEYDSMKCMYEALLEQLRAQAEGEKEAVSNAAQDTNLLS